MPIGLLIFTRHVPRIHPYPASTALSRTSEPGPPARASMPRLAAHIHAAAPVIHEQTATPVEEQSPLKNISPASSTEEEPGLTEFLKDASLSGEATEEEIAFLRSLQFGTRRPTAFYYYRELQSLRDPLHFRAPDRSRSR